LSIVYTFVYSVSVEVVILNHQTLGV
jgi:hypothetical protein